MEEWKIKGRPALLILHMQKGFLKEGSMML